MFILVLDYRRFWDTNFITFFSTCFRHLSTWSCFPFEISFDCRVSWQRARWLNVTKTMRSKKVLPRPSHLPNISIPRTPIIHHNYPLRLICLLNISRVIGILRKCVKNAACEKCPSSHNIFPHARRTNPSTPLPLQQRILAIKKQILGCSGRALVMVGDYHSATSGSLHR